MFQSSRDLWSFLSIHKISQAFPIEGRRRGIDSSEAGRGAREGRKPPAVKAKITPLLFLQ
jgi:hypothetical protein